MERIKRNWKQLIVVAAFVLLFFLLMDFNGRLNELSRLNNQLAEIETEVGDLQSTKAGLENAVNYATSEAALNEYARMSGLIRDGEKLIVPLPQGTPISGSQAQPTIVPEVVENSDVWWALFFGK